MKATEVSSIAGALLFTPTPHVDERGFFCRTFDADIMRAAGVDPLSFVQDSVSRSAKGVVRGMHMRRPPGEAKLVRCSYGAVFDVIVDLRPESPTYLNWESFELDGDGQVSLYIPAGCAHGFQALTDPADVSYRIDSPHAPTRRRLHRLRRPTARHSMATTCFGRVTTGPACPAARGCPRRANVKVARMAQPSGLPTAALSLFHHAGCAPTAPPRRVEDKHGVAGGRPEQAGNHFLVEGAAVSHLVEIANCRPGALDVY